MARRRDTHITETTSEVIEVSADQPGERCPLCNAALEVGKLHRCERTSETVQYTKGKTCRRRRKP